LIFTEDQIDGLHFKTIIDFGSYKSFIQRN